MTLKKQHKPSHEEITETRKRLLGVFKALRKSGFIARANFSCCQGCAGDEICRQAENTSHKPYVFWHRQDEECGQRTGQWYLAHGHTHPEATDEQKQKAADMIALACRVAGLKVDWDGCTMYRIAVTGVAS